MRYEIDRSTTIIKQNGLLRIYQKGQTIIVPIAKIKEIVGSK